MNAEETMFSEGRQITGSTRLVGLLGGDVRYSLSLRLHNRAFDALGLNWAYLPLPVSAAAPERLGEAIRGLRALNFVGANVTMPFKERVIDHLDEITPAARRMGAVNTILHRRDGSLIGGNTDAEGFIADLGANGVSLPDRRVIVLAAGGAARAVAHGLAERGCAALYIVNRTAERAERLAAELTDSFPGQSVQIAPWSSRADLSTPGDGALVVNCTPVGMDGVRTPSGAESPWPAPIRPDQVVADLVYAPLHTPLLASAEAAGATAISGLGMLIQQAALSFSWWTNQVPPISQMQAALEL